jgi:hypothetical protein
MAASIERNHLAEFINRRMILKNDSINDEENLPKPRLEARKSSSPNDTILDKAVEQFMRWNCTTWWISDCVVEMKGRNTMPGGFFGRGPSRFPYEQIVAQRRPQMAALLSSAEGKDVLLGGPAL